MISNFSFVIFFAALLFPALHSVSLASGEAMVYVGTYTGGKSEGIYRFLLDLKTGETGQVKLVAKSTNPSFLALHPKYEYLYAVNEINEFAGLKSGAVSAFSIDSKTGDLSFLNQKPSSGEAPCHIVVDKKGKNVLLANYGGGSVASLPIDSKGKLGNATSFIKHKGSSVDPRRQNGPHGHSINLDADNRFVFAADLGLDKIMIYRFDADKGKLVSNSPPWVTLTPGSGPRHFGFHPSGKTAYVINELSSTISVFSYDSERGHLKEIQSISTLPQDYAGRSSTAEVQVHPNGRFVYGSNRGHDSIAVFRVDDNSGRLTAVQHQGQKIKTPRNFGIDPNGNFLLVASQSSDVISVFRIDQASGELMETGNHVNVPTPVCVKMIAR